MTDSAQTGIGTIGWFDLTVGAAEEIRDFYAAVVDWASSPVAMGGYNDFNMIRPETEDPIAGICHARHGNSDLPPVWLLYITVEDLEASADRTDNPAAHELEAPDCEP